MKRVITAASAALAIALGGAAIAQTATTTTTTTAPAAPAATSSVTTVTTDQQSKIKAYVVKEKVKSVAAPSGFTVSTGATLPSSVEVRTFPADVGVKHSYAVVGDRTVIVEPSSRRIIQVIQ
jgi:hypothetical protein